jgi:predicted DNA-binding transcriptional regulator YafY
MPVVKNARFRERTLNDILRNRNRKYTLDQIRRELSIRLGTDISRSTLYADMAHLKEEYGCVIVKNHDGQYFYEDPEFSIVVDNAPLDDEDKKLLDMAESIFRIFSSSPIYAKFQSTIDKVLTGSKITKFERKQMDCIQPEKNISVVGGVYIEPILNAILEQTAIEIIYQKEGQEPEIKVISPYVLKQVDQHWYMIGFDNLKTSLTKNYSLDKILSVKRSKQDYYFDDSFDAGQFFKYSYGIYHNYKDTPQKIKLEFTDPYINTIINYPLSPYQTHTLSKDGKKLTVNLELYDSWEIVSEILKYGASVKVLAPASLAKKIKGIAEEIVKGYK